MNSYVFASYCCVVLQLLLWSGLVDEEIWISKLKLKIKLSMAILQLLCKNESEYVKNVWLFLQWSFSLSSLLNTSWHDAFSKSFCIEGAVINLPPQINFVNEFCKFHFVQGFRYVYEWLEYKRLSLKPIFFVEKFGILVKICRKRCCRLVDPVKLRFSNGG